MRSPIPALAILLVCCGPQGPGPTRSAPVGDSSTSSAPAHGLEQREVHEPQWVVTGPGAVALLWREPASGGSDLYFARRGPAGRFGTPLRVNHEAGTVESTPLDELRPAVAVGSDGRIAVAWGDSRGQVRFALSEGPGTPFDDSRRLEQAEGASYRGFPALAFDADDVLHAVWIDARLAARQGAEEPADLFYARVDGGEVRERNLTAEQGSSVCGCCRPFLEATDRGRIRAVFRNTTAEGYRDPFVVVGSLEEGFSPPRPAAEPLWELRGCPMAGPVAVGDSVLWVDGSEGRKRLVAGAGPGRNAHELLAYGDPPGWKVALPPRRAASAVPGTPVLLVPGRPTSRLIAPAGSGGGWRILAEGLPAWATGALLEGRAVSLLGAVEGELRIEVRRGIGDGSDA